MYNIHLLPAAFGDSILIEYGDTGKEKYILIDGGPYYNYPILAEALKKVCPKLEALELLIVTHVDIDHIDGIVRMLNESSLNFVIEEIWFNGLEQLNKIPSNLLGVDQGDYLSILIKEKNIPQNISHFLGGPVMINEEGLPRFTLRGGMKIILISPDESTLVELQRKWEKESEYLKDPETFRMKLEEDCRYSDLALLGEEEISDWQQETIVADNALANRSSIAFIGEYEGKSCLFSGDAPTSVHLKVVDQLLKEIGAEKLKLNAWKLAHHGSKKSTLLSLMNKIDADKILVSSNGARYKHPEPQTIAKLLLPKMEGMEFHFNYLTLFNQYWDDDTIKMKYRYQTYYGKDDIGLSVNL